MSYHLPHAILAVILSLNVLKEGAAARWAWRFIIVGILLFSGSLYVLAITQVARGHHTSRWPQFDAGLAHAGLGATCSEAMS